MQSLRVDIARFIRQAGGLEMPDLREKAEACQRRIEALGFRWDPVRLLWRAPIRCSPSYKGGSFR
jgi:hypothetical protein